MNDIQHALENYVNGNLKDAKREFKNTGESLEYFRNLYIDYISPDSYSIELFNKRMA